MRLTGRGAEYSAGLRDEMRFHCGSAHVAASAMARWWRQRATATHAQWSCAVLRRWSETLLGLRFEGLLTEAAFEELWASAAALVQFACRLSALHRSR